MLSATTLIALLVSFGFPEPQAKAIERYSHTQAGLYIDGERVLDPCATSWMGDGLFGLTQTLRRDLHREAGTHGCVPAEAQVQFLVHAWPEHYPNCSARFARGDLRAFSRCFGLGEGS